MPAYTLNRFVLLQVKQQLVMEDTPYIMHNNTIQSLV